MGLGWIKLHTTSLIHLYLVFVLKIVSMLEIPLRIYFRISYLKLQDMTGGYNSLVFPPMTGNIVLLRKNFAGKYLHPPKQP